MVYICFKIGFCYRRAEFTNQKNGAISILVSFTMSNKFSGSSRLHKKLQCLAVFAAYDATNKKKAMSSAAIDKNVELLYVGDPAANESMGLAEQRVCGIGQFADLYNAEDMATVTSSAGAGGMDAFLCSGGTVLVIKPELHCLGECNRIVVGGYSGGLTLPMMLVAASLADKEGGNPIRGRSLHARTKEALRNCKKALAVVLRHDSPYKACGIPGMLPSGMSFEDYLVYIRKQMYAELQVSVHIYELVGVDDVPEVPEGSSTRITPPPMAEKEPVVPTIMPENWVVVFTGFLELLYLDQ